MLCSIVPDIVACQLGLLRSCIVSSKVNHDWKFLNKLRCVVLGAKHHTHYVFIAPAHLMVLGEGSNPRVAGGKRPALELPSLRSFESAWTRFKPSCWGYKTCTSPAEVGLVCTWDAFNKIRPFVLLVQEVRHSIRPEILVHSVDWRDLILVAGCKY